MKHKNVNNHDLKENFNDGKRIFANKLIFYEPSYIDDYMLSLEQLFYKNIF
jgi:hypothetical protein